jgi:hypothetical protein
MPDSPKATQQPDAPCATPAPGSIQEARASGAVEGTNVVAPLAPATGPIQGPAESMVVVAVKHLKDTPTFKAVKKVFQASAILIFLSFGTACIGVWSDGKSLFDKGAMNFRNVERACEIAGGMSLVGGLMALMKTRDNNVAK